MLVGIRLKDNRYEIVATLNKELSLLHTATNSTSSSVVESLCECLVEFKLVQKTTPKFIICYFEANEEVNEAIVQLRKTMVKELFWTP